MRIAVYVRVSTPRTSSRCLHPHPLRLGTGLPELRVAMGGRLLPDSQDAPANLLLVLPARMGMAWRTCLWVWAVARAAGQWPTIKMGMTCADTFMRAQRNLVNAYGRGVRRRMSSRAADRRRLSDRYSASPMRSAPFRSRVQRHSGTKPSLLRRCEHTRQGPPREY